MKISEKKQVIISAAELIGGEWEKESSGDVYRLNISDCFCLTIGKYECQMYSPRQGRSFGKPYTICQLDAWQKLSHGGKITREIRNSANGRRFDETFENRLYAEIANRRTKAKGKTK